MPYKANIDLNAKKSLTDNKNLLAGVSFKMTIDKTFVPNVEYFISSVQMPEISVNPAQFATPQRNAKVPGDKAEYAPLTLEFMIDEGMENWKEIHDWLLAEVIKNDEINKDGKQRDITLSIMSSHNNVVREIQFVDCFPTSLSGMEFNLQQSDVVYLTSSVTFEYSYYKVI